MLLVLF